MDPLTRLEIEHTCRESGNTFQRRARLMQSIWREERGYPMGISTDANPPRPIGSVLEAGWAEVTLANFLTETIRDVVRGELEPVKKRGKLCEEERLLRNCLSSQPMCFNLFAELQCDLELATAVVRDMVGCEIDRVTGVEFEYSPGRGDARYTADSSAFDVLFRFDTRRGGRGLLGIEVKYHEKLNASVAKHRPRYDEVSSVMGCFAPDPEGRLRKNPLQQIWHTHLLAGSMIDADAYEVGHFGVLRPRDNATCARGVAEYRACLTDEKTFSEWLLEDVVQVLRRHTDASWVEAFWDRYLDFGKVDRELARLASDER